MLQMNVGQMYFDQMPFPVFQFFLFSSQKATLAKIQILARSPDFASSRYFPAGFLEAIFSRASWRRSRVHISYNLGSWRHGVLWNDWLKLEG